LKKEVQLCKGRIEELRIRSETAEIGKQSFLKYIERLSRVGFEQAKATQNIKLQEALAEAKEELERERAQRMELELKLGQTKI